MIDREEYFQRQIQLWGKEVQSSLKDKKIAIIGSGGLGCSLSLALGTSGIGFIDVVDFDRVNINNIHRQITLDLKDRERFKAEVTVEKIRSRTPFVEIQPFNMDFEEFKKLGRYHDLILDATDNLDTRESIDRYAKEKNIPWIYGSVEEFHGQVCFFEKTSFNIFNSSNNHIPSGVTTPIVMYVASLQATLALRYLTKLPVAKEKLYYLYFNDDGELITQKFAIPKH